MNKQEIILGAGCFWGVEERFRTTEGVLETEVGYAGGHTDQPTYEQVCGHATGHAEVVRVVYDSDVVSTTALLQLFYAMHDPTQIDRQGPDVGDQYRSVVFFQSPEQQEIAESLKVSAASEKGLSYATQIVEAGHFYVAEDYHQKYLFKRNARTCSI